MAGTSGKSFRLEGIKIKLEDQEYTGDIEYTTHVQYIGWQSFVKNDEMAGTSGKALRLEAARIRLTGEIAEHYDPYTVYLNVTGGEPLMRQDLFDILEYAVSLGYRWGMTTNGMLINEKMFKKIWNYCLILENKENL